VQEDERLIVVVLKERALPLVGNTAGDQVHLGPSSSPQRAEAEEGMLPDRPTWIRKRGVRGGVSHAEWR
jgi:hypothetical protein